MSRLQPDLAGHLARDPRVSRESQPGVPGGGARASLVERRPEKKKLILISRSEWALMGRGRSELGCRPISVQGQGPGALVLRSHAAGGLVGGAVAQQPLAASCFRFVEQGAERRFGKRWPQTGTEDRGLRPAALRPRLPAPGPHSWGLLSFGCCVFRDR